MNAATHDFAKYVTFGDRQAPVTLQDIESVAVQSSRAELSDAAMDRAAASEHFLGNLIRDGRAIYGVTTGYGPLADNQIDPAVGSTLQRNLVYHLASGVGDPLSPEASRAVVAARLATLTRGLSAVRPELLNWMSAFLNAGLAPVIPEKGTVGASGDLTPLAHMALAFMGEGQIWHNGKPEHAGHVLASIGMAPVSLYHKEGIALVNGTSAMSGVAALNGVQARRLLRLAGLTTIAYAEVLGGHRAAWHPLSAVARAHPGQKRAANFLWSLTERAGRLIPFAPLPEKISDDFGDDGVLHDQTMPQDAYSIRCAPQLLGAVDDMLVHHDGIVMTELSSVTDNPMVFPDEECILHAGNFFGQHVSFASDNLSNAVTMLGVLAERQVARITDVSLNRGLPAFLQGNATGLNSGFMGAQVTASALVAELRTKSAPASIQSVPTNGNNQDVVTMGTIAARRARDSVTDVSRILAINAMCVAQAMDLRLRENPEGFSEAAWAIHKLVRSHSEFLDADRPLTGDIASLAQAMATRSSERITNTHTGSITQALAEF